MKDKTSRMELLQSFTKNELIEAIYEEWQRVSIPVPSTEVKSRLNTINRIIVLACTKRNRRVI